MSGSRVRAPDIASTSVLVWESLGASVVLGGSLLGPEASSRVAYIGLVPDALRWREGRGLTQAEAAEALGVGIATVKRAEAHPAKELGPALRGKTSALR